MEVAHLVGSHKQWYLQKLEEASLETDPYLRPSDVLCDLVKSLSSSEFTFHDLYHYVINCVSSHTRADLEAYKSLDANWFSVYMLDYMMIGGIYANMLHNKLFAFMSLILNEVNEL